jgi:hypothetical protein
VLHHVLCFCSIDPIYKLKFEPPQMKQTECWKKSKEHTFSDRYRNRHQEVGEALCKWRDTAQTLSLSS